MEPSRRMTRVLWVTVVLLALVGVGVAARRTVVLVRPGEMNARKSPATALDGHFAKERALTLLHVLPGIVFMILGPLQFVRRLRTKYPATHRWSGRVFLTASAVIGVTGLAMAAMGTIGGRDEKAAIFIFGSFFLMALGKALWHGMRHEFVKHREWMIRGYAVGLAVATIRPIMGGFFAAAAMHGQTPEPSRFFGTAFWIGFTAQTLVAEIWVRWTHRYQLPEELSALTRS